MSRPCFLHSRGALKRTALFLALVFPAITGCLSPPSIVVGDLLEPLALPIPWVPNDGDLAAAKLARVALVTEHITEAETAPLHSAAVSPRVESALLTLAALTPSQRTKHLLPLAIDLRNTTLDDPIAYRSSSRLLRREQKLDPRLRSRLDRTIDDDPIRLAKRRQLDGWHRLWARTFNTVSEPLGSTIITGFVLAPFQLANSITHYFADFSNNEPLSLTDRQALALRKEFLHKHPNTKLTENLDRKIEASTIRLEKTLALRRVRAGQKALDGGHADLALYQAEYASRALMGHPSKNLRLRKRAQRIKGQASKRLHEQSQRRIESLRSTPIAMQSEEPEVALSRLLISSPASSPELDPRIATYLAAAGHSGDGAIDFILALRQHENGHDDAARKRLTQLANEGPIKSKMARHAQALLDDAWQNPFGAFNRLERSANRDEFAWRVAGEWVRRTRYPNLPTPLAYLIDAPTIAMTVILAPLRALTSPWTGSPDFRRAAALAGYRYLVRFPDGAEQRAVIDWLYDYEKDEKRWGRALRLADLIPHFDPEERSKLVEETAEKRITYVDRLNRRDNRKSVLEGVVREFPDSKGGREAGLRARAESLDASPQHIRITKSFMLENPSVAGSEGLGLNPVLLNGSDADGELHPDGVILRGGRVLEILLIADGADDDDPPKPSVRKVSRQRLSQIASTLDEAVQRNGLIDVGARQAPDAGRDVYLERASLGLTDRIDHRATAESTFVYQSLRERYGIVRGRDSILPFDLVFRGSLGDFTLGAFPRWRAPRETPDAFLYR